MEGAQVQAGADHHHCQNHDAIPHRYARTYVCTNSKKKAKLPASRYTYIIACFSDDEQRNFHKSVLHFMNALRIKENPGDLLHIVTVCTDTTNVVTKQYMGSGKINYINVRTHS